MTKLSRAFYTGDDVVQIARNLLGQVLIVNKGSGYFEARIVETEAYNGRTDAACHAHNNRFTERTQIMYEEGGVAYVYLCYGIHNLFNIVTNTKGKADAVLVRAVEPIKGIKEMMVNRGKTQMDYTLTSGPGSLTQALGIKKTDYGEDLLGSSIWIEEDEGLSDTQVVTKPRIGVDYAGEDALLPWRFYEKGNPWVSRK